MRAVLDVNVLVSGFPASDGPPAQILTAWSNGDFELVLSAHVLDGCLRAWRKPYYLTRYTEGQIEQTIATLLTDASMVIPVDTVHAVGDDEEDDLILATAVAAQAVYLVTGDKGLLNLGTYQGVAIVSPREFLKLLGQETDAV